jgi:diguanylate cyclase (GGDEF)-like protein
VLPRILVADDDRVTVLLISAALRGEFDVVVATTGAEVLELAAAGNFDLVLLDVMLPDLDGFEVCRRLTHQLQGARVPVIFVTSLDQTADETRGFEAGGVDYITKPIRPSVVQARVRTHIELKRSRDALERLAAVDPLTGIANRRGFDDAMQLEWRRSQRSSRWLSVAMVDADQFKRFNDRYGHLAGDERLRSIATALAGCAQRAGEVSARYGGEEFALILPDAEPAIMQSLLHTLLCNVAFVHPSAATAGAREVKTVSVGAISVIAPRDADETSALAAADALLYEAKGSGRDCCVYQDLATRQKWTIRRAAG